MTPPPPISHDVASVEAVETFKGTPGPWRLFMTTDGRKLIGIGDEDGGGVTDAGFGTWRDGDEQLANARLIAAAPELLEAALAVRLAFDAVPEIVIEGAFSADVLGAVLAARAAIAKALGGAA